MTESAAAAAAPEKIEAPPPPPPDWSELPVDLLNNVAERIVANVADYIRFRAVCKAWRSARAVPRPGSRLPWLLLQWEYEERRLSFFSTADSRTYSVPVPPAAARAASGSFCSSCNGWLILEDTDALTISLVNPLTGGFIQLPAASPSLINTRKRENVIVYEEGVEKTCTTTTTMVLGMAMSSDPAAAGQDCTVVVVSLCNFALVSIRIGDGDWMLMDIAAKYHDVIYRNGSFYAVNNLCGVTIFDSGLNKVNVIPTPGLSGWQCLRHWRFVQVSGELLLLRKIYKEHPITDDFKHPPRYPINKFQVFRLKLEGADGKTSVAEVKNLGDNILFYGFANGFAYPAAEYPGGKPNAIYSTGEYITMLKQDKNIYSYVEPGVYDMASATVEPLPDGMQVPRTSACYSTWLIPTL